MTFAGHNIMPNLVNRRAPVNYATALVTLMRMGVDLSRVRMLAVGEYENYRGEIRAQSPEPGEEFGPSTEIKLEVGCPSAVDQMPYQFFYGLGDATVSGTQWEEDARHLMAPFDAEVIRHRGEARSHILRLTYGCFDRTQVERLIGAFGVELPDMELDDREVTILASLLPSYNEWAGNALAVAKVLENFFGHSFEIVENVPQRTKIPARLRYHLAQTSAGLGRETVLGDSFVECDSTCLVVMRGVSPDLAGQLLPGGLLRKKLDWILKLAIPGNLECKLKVLPVERGMRIGSTQGSTRLGVASCL